MVDANALLMEHLGVQLNAADGLAGGEGVPDMVTNAVVREIERRTRGRSVEVKSNKVPSETVGPWISGSGSTTYARHYRESGRLAALLDPGVRWTVWSPTGELTGMGEIRALMSNLAEAMLRASNRLGDVLDTNVDPLDGLEEGGRLQREVARAIERARRAEEERERRREAVNAREAARAAENADVNDDEEVDADEDMSAEEELLAALAAEECLTTEPRVESPGSLMAKGAEMGAASAAVEATAKRLIMALGGDPTNPLGVHAAKLSLVLLARQLGVPMLGTDAQAFAKVRLDRALVGVSTSASATATSSLLELLKPLVSAMTAGPEGAVPHLLGTASGIEEEVEAYQRQRATAAVR